MLLIETIHKAPSTRELKSLEAVGPPIQKTFDSDVLRILAFSDYRVQDISQLLEFIKGLQPKPNLILYAGDDLERFHTETRNLFEELASFSTHGFCAVLGNDAENEKSAIRNSETHASLKVQTRFIPDIKTLRKSIRGRSVYNVHESPLVIGDYAVIGSEGAPLDEKFGEMGAVIYSEQSIARHLALAAKRVGRKSLIVVSHCPPRGLLDRAIRFGRRPIGSIALRQFLSKRKNAPLVVCGHIHSCGARTKKCKHSTIVNAASHDDFGAPGRIALIELQKNKVRNVRWHNLWELTSVTGVKDSRAARLKLSGISTLAELADAPIEYIRQALRCGEAEASIFKARASSLLKQQVIVSGVLDIARENRAYIDIETDLRGTFVWLVGLHVEAEARSYTFFADTPGHEKEALTELFQFLTAKPGLQLLSYSNCGIEQRLLPQRFSAHGLTALVVERIRDIYYAIHASAAFPLQNTTLKAISECCGFKARHPGMDGFLAASCYGSGNPNKRLRRKLIEYNEDDILSLKHVVQFIESRLTPGRSLR